MRSTRAFGSHPHRLHYALKANSTLGLARTLRELGSAADANSIWEIELARKAGLFRRPTSSSPASASRPPSSSAPCRSGLKAINVESVGELARVEAIAARLGADCARRAPRQPRHRREEPSAHFDRPQDQQVRHPARRCARAVRRRSASRRSLKLVALHVHIGSQITTHRTAGALRRARRRARRGARRRSCRRSRSSTSISAAVSAFLTTGARCRPSSSTRRRS